MNSIDRVKQYMIISKYDLLNVSFVIIFKKNVQLNKIMNLLKFNKQFIKGYAKMTLI